MGKSRGQRSQDKNKGSLPKGQKNMKSDGRDVEFSREFADQDDLGALARSNAADTRAKEE